MKLDNPKTGALLVEEGRFVHLLKDVKSFDSTGLPLYNTFDINYRINSSCYIYSKEDRIKFNQVFYEQELISILYGVYID